MEKVAINNLKVLTHPTKLAANQFSLKHNEMAMSDGDSFDTIYSLGELEYPIYFTFHQLLNHVHSSYDHHVCGYTRKELIELMIDALDNLMDYYENTDMKNLNFGIMLDDIDDKVFFVQQYYRYGWCIWLPTFIKETINRGCRFTLACSKEIVKDYIEMCDVNNEIDSSDDEGTDEGTDDVDESGEAVNDSSSSDDIPDLDESTHPKVD
jgi:hypothetical protein